MKIKRIKTRKFLPPKDDLEKVFTESVKSVRENSIVCITSKVVSIDEGNCIPKSEIDKNDLIKKEADLYIEKTEDMHRHHTIKNNLVVGSAGIDESNVGDYYCLWPEDPWASAKRLWEFVRTKYAVNNLGIILTDSTSIWLRRGIIGLSLSYYGFEPLRDYRGKKDLFGRNFKFSQTNIPDSISSFAVFLMGEGAESIPIVIFEDLPDIKYLDHEYEPKGEYSSFEVKKENDLFSVFLNNVEWKKGGSGK